MAIQFENVTFYYNSKSKIDPVLKKINLKINAKNDFIALIGKIGSGKSTLVQLMNSLLIPKEGYIEIFNRKIDKKTSPQLLTSFKKKIGLVFQFPEYQIFENTVLKDVMFGPKNFNMTNEEAKKKAIEALKQVGLEEELFDSSPFKLSEGQQRKVAIAGVLAMEPSILILDEPTRGLDIDSQKQIMSILQKKNQKDNKTIIFITHDINLVSEYANKVLLLEKGKIIFYGYKEDFFHNVELSKFNFIEPRTFQILKFLNKELEIPFEYKYSSFELFKYLKEVCESYKKND
ncbi:MAG: ATP-binding cassette domain-containing protein [Candidatus Phytoplasma stylosanthis]|uniref:ATP-binding cassette domain-containing protein n=1 Tax=Candidatus Phytoplasma stylosanthis TaxID=2798314 RepID=UPI0029399963|nr:ATP-binding cassette domain-containing protein [Candidatus Phytoplasma stylosanthis]MDV3167867.1 ATP-binding cassette domain-containing protein [Candidatus Phytoplasma stylosanthis]MDV3170857.1 ATP-binding cassette domain-containing protein [Candidatus Phytoplasma stylosanthis]MDV3173517.1 ATP-binding cassette domain-containing protein [Candidatus Phytoplasma stylosanthis]MDV3174037.1 ATP-binding cassette domain-containing protein [Candidatus Phytoplasma stylosanthis]MDV3202451.1 ATP-bindin